MWALEAACFEERKIREIPAQMIEMNEQWMNTSQEFNQGDPWLRPTAAHNAYPLDWTVTHNGETWVSLVASNVWEPSVSGWREWTGDNEWPAWVQPTGGHDAYARNARVSHVDKHWTSDIDANVWEPGVYGWTSV